VEQKRIAQPLRRQRRAYSSRKPTVPPIHHGHTTIGCGPHCWRPHSRL